MAAQTVSINNKIVKELFDAIGELKREMAILGEKFDIEPPYGSKDWWAWANKRALKSIKEGKGTVIRNQKELNEFFQNL